MSHIYFIFQGIDIDTGGTIHHFHGYLIAFIGDTPASGLVGGFKEGVGSAYRGCRSCMITKNDLCSKVYLQARNGTHDNILFLAQVFSVTATESGKA